MKLRRFDFLLVPIESTYDVVERVPVIGPIGLLQQDGRSSLVIAWLVDLYSF